MRGLVFLFVLYFLCVKAITNPCEITSQKLYDDAFKTMETRILCEGSEFKGSLCTEYWMNQGRLEREEIFNQVCRDSTIQKYFEFLGIDHHPGIFFYEQEKTTDLVKDEYKKLSDKIDGYVEDIEKAIEREEYENRRLDEEKEHEIREDIHEGTLLLKRQIWEGVDEIKEELTHEIEYDAKKTRELVYEDAQYTKADVKQEEKETRESFRYLEHGIKESWEDVVSKITGLIGEFEFALEKEKDTFLTLLNHVNLQTNLRAHEKEHKNTILNQFTPVDLFQRPGRYYDKMRDICYDTITYNKEHYGENQDAEHEFNTAEFFKGRGDYRAAAVHLRAAYTFAVVPSQRMPWDGN